MAVPRTLMQGRYMKALRSNLKSIVIATGPAGSGKTLLACQVAAEQLQSKNVKKVIITRPVVTVDEELGYLPGRLEEKMDPYMRPVMDIFDNYFTRSRVKQLMSNGTLEIAPLAYMRGRTFENAFIIGDETQNTTKNQMKMFLTRIGEDSKMIITGDIHQCDLPDPLSNGLLDIVNRMNGSADILKYIEHVELSVEDIQRHPAVGEILDIYGE